MVKQPNPTQPKTKNPSPTQAAVYDQQPEATAAPGFAGLLKGTDQIKAAFVTDRGFCKEIAQKYQKLGVKSPKQWCQDNDVPFFYPYNENDEDGLMYDAIQHIITVVPKEEAPVSLGNILIRWLHYSTLS